MVLVDGNRFVPRADFAVSRIGALRRDAVLFVSQCEDVFLTVVGRGCFWAAFQCSGLEKGIGLLSGTAPRHPAGDSDGRDRDSNAKRTLAQRDPDVGCDQRLQPNPTVAAGWRLGGSCFVLLSAAVVGRSVPIGRRDCHDLYWSHLAAAFLHRLRRTDAIGCSGGG